MSKELGKLEDHEKIAIALYQEKMAYFNLMLSNYVNSILTQRGLTPGDCTVDVSTGIISKKPVEKKDKTPS